jgi:hypothetical protein
MFTFLVGENQTPIVVHAAAIAQLSKALNTLINGPMVEAQTLTASWKDVSEEDLLRFCEFAYAGDYSTPPCRMAAETQLTLQSQKADSTLDMDGPPPEEEALDWPPPSPQPVPPPPPPPLLDDDWASFVPKKKAKPSKTASLRRSFDVKSKFSRQPSHPFPEAYLVVANTKCTEDYTPVFLAHARLYAVADKYGVEPLQRLSLHKLHTTLVQFTLYEERIEDIADLVRFSYNDNHTRDSGSDDLRALVLRFVTSRHDVIGESEPFLSLLEEGGTFARDFWVFARKNLILEAQ